MKMKNLKRDEEVEKNQSPKLTEEKTIPSINILTFFEVFEGRNNNYRKENFIIG